jgi:hypothetical protein
MTLCREPVGVLAGVLILCCGASWLYWLNAILVEVNPTLPKEQRLELLGLNSGTFWSDLKRRWRADWKMHWFWDEHVRLFPKSRKRFYAAISIILFFLTPIANLTICLLFTDR